MKKTLITLVIFYLSGSLLANCPEVLDHEVRLLDSKAVSYTHLTLPTILLV